jgi:hypothetical protein
VQGQRLRSGNGYLRQAAIEFQKISRNKCDPQYPAFLERIDTRLPASIWEGLNDRSYDAVTSAISEYGSVRSRRSILLLDIEALEKSGFYCLSGVHDTLRLVKAYPRDILQEYGVFGVPDILDYNRIVFPVRDETSMGNFALIILDLVSHCFLRLLDTSSLNPLTFGTNTAVLFCFRCRRTIPEITR